MMDINIKKTGFLIIMCMFLLGLPFSRISILHAQDIPTQKQAEWAMNTKLGIYYPKLDFASDRIVIFHSYFGLFLYDAEEEKLIASLDLEALGCTDLFEKSEENIKVNQDGTIISISSQASDDVYYYDVKNRSFIADEALVQTDNVENFINFNILVNSRTINNGMQDVEKYFLSENSVPFEDGSFGSLYMEDENVSGIFYIRGDKKYKIFTEELQTCPKLLKQTDSYYNAYSSKAKKSKSDFMFVYMGFLNNSDYAGICSISNDMSYNDKQQKSWGSLDALVSSKVIDSKDNKMHVELYFNIIDPGETTLEKGKYVKNISITNGNDGWRADALILK